MLGFAAKLLAVFGERRRAREATAALAVLNDRMLADIGLRREDVPFAARGGLGRRWVRMDGLAQSRRYLAALALVTVAIAGLTFAAPPARAEGEGNGDPFALHVPGEVVSVGRAPQAQAGMDAGPQTFRPLPATREVRAAPAPQTAVGRFALQTRP
jgi:uncharacterized protein YjiS (DUF1127 family)